jgi:hypothetical protein
MAVVGVIVGTLVLAMLYFAPPAPASGNAAPVKATPANTTVPALPVNGAEADGQPATDLSKKSVPAATAAVRFAATNARPGPPTSASAVMKEPVVPKWTGGLHNAWSKHPSAAYELTAENHVALMAKRVRPVLTVRCESGRTEVFVLTESAAVIEGDDGKHTVKVGFDGTADLTQRWLASADYDALFAPDPVRLAQQIAASRSMRFGFTPYGAAPVVAQFDVSGFDTLIRTVAKACRWQ